MMNVRIKNRIEIINELMFCFICFFVICFTPAIEDGKVKLGYGWQMIMILSLVLVYNSWFIIYDLFRNICFRTRVIIGSNILDVTFGTIVIFVNGLNVDSFLIRSCFLARHFAIGLVSVGLLGKVEVS